MCQECEKFENAAEINHEKYLEAVTRAERAEALVDDVRVIASKLNDIEWYQARGLLAKIVARVGGVAKAG